MYCNAAVGVQGTLRDALDHKSLLRNTPSPYLLPALVMNLAQDVSAALLHLHSEGEGKLQTCSERMGCDDAGSNHTQGQGAGKVQLSFFFLRFQCIFRNLSVVSFVNGGDLRAHAAW